MSDGFIKKAGQSAGDAAKQIARQVAREPVEILTHVKSQALNVESHPPLVNEIIADKNLKQVTKLEEAAINVQTNKRLNELEEEIKRIQDQRLQKEQVWSQEQEAKMGNLPQSQVQEKPLIEPSTRPKRGLMGAVKGKQGTKEMAKSPSG